MNRKTFLRKLCIAFVLVMSLSIITPIESQAAIKNNIGNVVKLYRQGKYSEAKKMMKKLPKKASKKYAKNMSKKMKKAYLKKVKSFKSMKSWSSAGQTPKNGYIWGYYLTDINNDKKTDLIVHHGTSAAREFVSVYTYTKGKVKKFGTVQVRGIELHDYPGKQGVIVMACLKYSENMSILKVQNNKLKWEKVNTRSVPSGKYIKMPYKLADHRNWKYAYVVNLNPLK